LEWHLTIRSDTWVGHLSVILAKGGGNLNEPIFKNSNAQDCQSDWHIIPPPLKIPVKQHNFPQKISYNITILLN